MSDVRWIEAAPAELRSAVSLDVDPVIDLRGTDAMVVLDRSGTLVGADAEAGQLLGMSLDSLLGRPPADARWRMCRADGALLPESENPVAVALTTGQEVLGHVLGLESDGDADGQRFTWVEVSAYPVRGADGAVTGAATRWRDVSDSAQGHRAMASMVRSFRELGRASQEDQERFRVLAENSADVVFQTDTVGRCVWVSASVLDVLGWTPEALVGTSLLPLLHPDDREMANERRRLSLAGGGSGHDRLELRYATAAGRWRWMSAMSRPLRDPSGRVLGGLSALRDIQGEVERREEARHLDVHDSLTGLLSRDSAIHALARALEQARIAGTSVGVLYLDIDRFKDINDTFGHQAGDRLLISVGHRLVAALRDADIVARLGGDEFLVILTAMRDPAGVERRASALLDVVSEPGDGTLPSATVSIGMATDDGSAEPGQVLRDADAALYRAKSDGRNRLSR